LAAWRSDLVGPFGIAGLFAADALDVPCIDGRSAVAVGRTLGAVVAGTCLGCTRAAAGTSFGWDERPAGAEELLGFVVAVTDWRSLLLFYLVKCLVN